LKSLSDQWLACRIIARKDKAAEFGKCSFIIAGARDVFKADTILYAKSNPKKWLPER
jgi:hypothetical protein